MNTEITDTVTDTNLGSASKCGEIRTKLDGLRKETKVLRDELIEFLPELTQEAAESVAADIEAGARAPINVDSLSTITVDQVEYAVSEEDPNGVLCILADANNARERFLNTEGKRASIADEVRNARIESYVLNLSKSKRRSKSGRSTGSVTLRYRI